MAIHGIRESGKHKPQELRYEARSVIHADDFMQMFTQLKRVPHRTASAAIFASKHLHCKSLSCDVDEDTIGGISNL